MHSFSVENRISSIVDDIHLNANIFKHPVPTGFSRLQLHSRYSVCEGQTSLEPFLHKLADRV